MIHSSFYTGSKIRIIEKDGTVTIAKFLENRKGKKIITDKGEFRFLDIRSVNYYKPLPHEIHK